MDMAKTLEMKSGLELSQELTNIAMDKGETKFIVRTSPFVYLLPDKVYVADWLILYRVNLNSEGGNR